MSSSDKFQPRDKRGHKYTVIISWGWLMVAQHLQWRDRRCQSAWQLFFSFPPFFFFGNDHFWIPWIIRSCNCTVIVGGIIIKMSLLWTLCAFPFSRNTSPDWHLLLFWCSFCSINALCRYFISSFFLVAVTKDTDSSLSELSFQKWLQNNNKKWFVFEGRQKAQKVNLPG